MSKKYIIIGKNGQLGSKLSQQLEHEAVSLSHNECNFNNPKDTADLLDKINSSVIFNACAYTNVDRAETSCDESYKANAEIPHILAKYCAENNIPLIHFSTDYVYSGKGVTPNKEDDTPSPLNEYGKSKLNGERNIIRTNCKHLIFRTSWVYDEYNNNFLTTMLRLAKERDELSIVSDQIGAPTYASDLAEKSIVSLKNALRKETFPSGVYNLCNEGETSWYEFANTIFSNAKKLGINLQIKNTNKISTSEYPTPAQRPLNSRLDCSKAKSVLNIQMPQWEESLKKCMENLVENTKNTNNRPACC